jgi:hypothetical protein
MRKSWLIGLVIVAACDMFAPKDETKDDDATSKTATPEKSSAPTAESTVASSVSVPQGASTPVPTPQEWDAVGEVTVKGSSALSCETKMIRDWFRAACRGKNDTGGRPTTVKVVAGRLPGTFEYAVGGVTSLVTPFMDGTHLEAVFSWTDKSHKLVLDWPKDKPKPQILGVYEGAKSPLDKPIGGDPKLIEAGCKCERKNPLFGAPNPQAECLDINQDCAHTYAATDCLKYQKCAIGEPGVQPTCRPGHVQVSINLCVKTCKTNADCTPGSGRCVEMENELKTKVCDL